MGEPVDMGLFKPIACKRNHQQVEISTMNKNTNAPSRYILHCIAITGISVAAIAGIQVEFLLVAESGVGNGYVPEQIAPLTNPGLIYQKFKLLQPKVAPSDSVSKRYVLKEFASRGFTFPYCC